MSNDQDIEITRTGVFTPFVRFVSGAIFLVSITGFAINGYRDIKDRQNQGLDRLNTIQSVLTEQRAELQQYNSDCQKRFEQLQQRIQQQEMQIQLLQQILKDRTLKNGQAGFEYEKN